MALPLELAHGNVWGIYHRGSGWDSWTAEKGEDGHPGSQPRRCGASPDFFLYFLATDSFKPSLSISALDWFSLNKLNKIRNNHCKLENIVTCWLELVT